MNSSSLLVGTKWYPKKKFIWSDFLFTRYSIVKVHSTRMLNDNEITNFMFANKLYRMTSEQFLKLFQRIEN